MIKSMLSTRMALRYCSRSTRLCVVTAGTSTNLIFFQSEFLKTLVLIPLFVLDRIIGTCLWKIFLIRFERPVLESPNTPILTFVPNLDSSSFIFAISATVRMQARLRRTCFANRFVQISSNDGSLGLMEKQEQSEAFDSLSKIKISEKYWIYSNY